MLNYNNQRVIIAYNVIYNYYFCYGLAGAYPNFFFGICYVTIHLLFVYLREIILLSTTLLKNVGTGFLILAILKMKQVA
jgi:hypothetical protein